MTDIGLVFRKEKFMERKSRGILFDPIQTENVLRGGEENSTFLKRMSPGDSLEEILADAENSYVTQSLRSGLIKIEY